MGLQNLSQINYLSLQMLTQVVKKQDLVLLGMEMLLEVEDRLSHFL